MQTAYNDEPVRPQIVPAIAGGAAIGTLGGLIGLGGAEFRLPLLISYFRFAPLESVILNKAISLVVVASAFLFRGWIIPFGSIADAWPIITNLSSWQPRRCLGWGRCSNSPGLQNSSPRDCRNAGWNRLYPAIRSFPLAICRFNTNRGSASHRGCSPRLPHRESWHQFWVLQAGNC
jgi:hypothetical protein